MGKGTKEWLIGATVLVILGFLVFAVSLTFCQWDFSRLSTDHYQTNVHPIRDPFSSICITANTADILLAPSDDGTCRVVCYESEQEVHSVAVRDNTLVIEVSQDKKWYDYIGIHADQPKITLCLPAEEYASLAIRTSTGDVEIPQDFLFTRIDISASTGDILNFASAADSVNICVSAGDIRVEKLTVPTLSLFISTGHITVADVSCEMDISITVSTGEVKITDTTCKNLNSQGDTGDIFLTNVLAAETVFIERSTGNVTFDRCDAGELSVKTDTGDVTGSLLSQKVFITETDTGKVKVPEGTSGGKCKICTSTGDIRIVIS